MKKKRLAGLLLLAPLCLLAACGGGGPTSLQISANWYGNTASKSIDGTNETLVYAVTFTPPTERGDYYVTYEEGTYTTKLSSSDYTFGDGNSATVYLYETELHISGHFTYRETVGETFNDSIVSRVYFHGLNEQDNNFRPIESHKEIHSTNPVYSPSEEYLSDTLSISYDAKYSTAAAVNAPLESVAVTRANLTTEQKEEAEIEIDTSSSYFDNEQILFALRGLSMEQAVSFDTNNMQTNEIATVNFSAAPKAVSYAETFNVNGSPREGDEIEAYEVQFIYSGTQSGMPRTVTYAKKTSSDNNLYRNVLLRLDDPIANGYGTLRYTLKNATFTR